jgi:hypothetical protein
MYVRKMNEQIDKRQGGQLNQRRRARSRAATLLLRRWANRVFRACIPLSIVHEVPSHDWQRAYYPRLNCAAISSLDWQLSSASAGERDRADKRA